MKSTKAFNKMFFLVAEYSSFEKKPNRYVQFLSQIFSYFYTKHN